MCALVLKGGPFYRYALPLKFNSLHGRIFPRGAASFPGFTRDPSMDGDRCWGQVEVERENIPVMVGAHTV